MLKFFFTNKTRTILFVSGKIKLKVLQLDWISLILDNFRWRSEICNYIVATSGMVQIKHTFLELNSRLPCAVYIINSDQLVEFFVWI